LWGNLTANIGWNLYQVDAIIATSVLLWAQSIDAVICSTVSLFLHNSPSVNLHRIVSYEKNKEVQKTNCLLFVDLKWLENWSVTNSQIECVPMDEHIQVIKSVMYLFVVCEVWSVKKSQHLLLSVNQSLHNLCQVVCVCVCVCVWVRACVHACVCSFLFEWHSGYCAQHLLSQCSSTALIGDMSYIAIVFILWRPALSSSASVTVLRWEPLN